MDGEELEQRLLGGGRALTRHDVADRAGVPPDLAGRLWRAMGFPNLRDGMTAFTDADLAALRRLMRLVDDGVFDLELAVGIIRAMGHHAARLADGQLESMLEHLRDDVGLAPTDAAHRAAELLCDHAEDLQLLLAYVWRRQLVAVAGRTLESGAEPGISSTLTVGFADLVSYTRLSQRLEERGLAVLVDRFHRRSADVIARCGGRLVKTVGDEVLFVADTAPVAVAIGLELVEAMGSTAGLPDVRVGVATGPVLTRMGDVFGSTVNLASRLTGLAAPASVLADGDTALALAEDAAVTVDLGRPRAVRGLGLVRSGVVRRVTG